MSVEYKDYYKILGVSKSASQDDMSKAFKKLARKHHPDLNPNDKKAEDKFKEINEAYEVLKDPEKRKLYDQLGPNWQHGQNFQPPPGFENVRFNFGGAGGPGNFDAGGFSDFFETLFGGAQGGASFGGGREYFGRGGGPGFSARPRRGQDSEAVLELTMEEAFHGGAKTLSLLEHVQGQAPRNKTLSVTIPAGVKEGAKIRLAGQGNPGSAGGSAGDLYMKVHILPHHLFYLDGANVVIDLPLAPWEAALGAKVRVPTLDGAVELNIPPGTDSGRKLRLGRRGLGAGANRGDQIVRVMVRVPSAGTDEEKALWESLAKTSSFTPRDY
jgi:curved DNA-binding protein